MCSARVGSNPILVDIFDKKFKVFQYKRSMKCIQMFLILSLNDNSKVEKDFRYRELNPGHLGESQVS